MSNLIINFDTFDGPNAHSFLSNFYIGKPLAVFGRDWLTGEHAYQGMKTIKKTERDSIALAASPGIAKRRGNKCTLRADWEEVKYDIMAAVVRAKFSEMRPEAGMLLATGDALLVEGTTWGDRIWGVAGKTIESPGRNWLGTLLMARRAELRSGLWPDTGFWNFMFTIEEKG